MKTSPPESGGPSLPPLGPIEDFRAWVRRVAGHIDRFFFTPADPTTLGFIRISAGLLTLFVHFCYCFGLFQYVGPQGWVDLDYGHWLRQEVSIQAPIWDWPAEGQQQLFEEYAKGQYYWSIYYHVTDPRWIVAIHAGIMVVMALFTVGFATRITSVLTWLGALQYVQRAPSLLYGMDTMMMILLFYLMIGPSGAALSVDRWLQRWREKRWRGVASLPDLAPPPLVSANFAIRLIQIHFCIIYLAAGTSKLLGSTWWAGTAPSLTLLNAEFAPFNLSLYTSLMQFLAGHRWLWEILMTGGVLFTLFAELGFPFLVWLKSTRWLMVCCSVLLHLMIGVIMGLVVFSLFMMTMVFAFVPPEVTRHILGVCKERFRAILFRSAGSAQGRAKRPALSRT
jgi:hypothetical protein